MAGERIGDMTEEEFKQRVFELIDERLRDKYPYVQRSDRPVAEILKSMRENIWKPPPGAKSSLELLREDRDR
jgi:hypothetical protein